MCKGDKDTCIFHRCFQKGSIRRQDQQRALWKWPCTTSCREDRSTVPLCSALLLCVLLSQCDQNSPSQFWFRQVSLVQTVRI